MTEPEFSFRKITQNVVQKNINRSKDESLGPLGMSLPETNWRFKAGLDSGGGSRGAKNTRCVSEAGATELTEACRAKKR